LTDIKQNVNNDYIKEVAFTFGEAGDHSAFLSLSDNIDKTRYSISEKFVPKEKLNEQ
jgi:hypothetical protein